MPILGEQSKKHFGELSIIFDIGGNSIGGGILEHGASVQPRLLYTTREVFTLEAQPVAHRLLSSMIRTLEIVADRILKEGIVHLNFTGLRQQKIKRVDVVLGTPWFTSEIRTVNTQNSSPFTVSPELIASIIKKEQAAVNKKLLEKMPTESEDQLVVIEHEIIRSKLNGYRTDNLYERKISELELIVLVSFSPKVVIERIQGQIEKHFNVDDWRIYSRALTISSALRNLSFDAANATLITVDGVTTDLLVLKRNTLVEAMSLPLGTNAILRSIRTFSKNMPLEAARSKIKLYLANIAENNFSSKTRAALDDFGNQWGASVSEALQNFSEEVFLPQRAILIVEPEYQKLFLSYLKGPHDSNLLLGRDVDAESRTFETMDTIHLSVGKNLPRTITDDLFLTLESVASYR